MATLVNFQETTCKEPECACVTSRRAPNNHPKRELRDKPLCARHGGTIGGSVGGKA